jgi:hypothetical protein
MMVIDITSVLRLLQRVVLGDVDDVSGVHAVSFFRSVNLSFIIMSY